ncbi:hypothetical protein N9N16_03355 [Porticoccaceae bacterium]|nr:hypothetical protein [Porticoccaceae bacterium]
MNKLLICLSLISPASLAYADTTTLKCTITQLCDAYVENCTVSPYGFVVAINPNESSVVMGGKQISANFTDEEVLFRHLGYTININKYEFSAILYNEKEVRIGSCKKTVTAW